MVGCVAPAGCLAVEVELELVMVSLLYEARRVIKPLTCPNVSVVGVVRVRVWQHALKDTAD
jgi:hypothetical protein